MVIKRTHISFLSPVAIPSGRRLLARVSSPITRGLNDDICLGRDAVFLSSIFDVTGQVSSAQCLLPMLSQLTLLY